MSAPIGTIESFHSELPLREKADILFTLGELALPRADYFLVGGANLVLRGVKRATRDIDALVSDELFDELQQAPGVKLKSPPLSARMRGATNATVWIERNDLAIPFTATTSMNDGYYPQSFESHHNRTELIDEVPCALLDDVWASKVALQRPYPASDMPDIEAISAYDERFDLNSIPAPTVRPVYHLIS